MSRRDLPSPAETMRILAERRTRPLRRAPPRAGRGLTKQLKPLEARFDHGPHALHTHWPEIVGERLARVSEPVRLVRSRAGQATLELRVAGPVAALITHQADDILARANLVLGAKSAAGKLKIIQGPVRAFPLTGAAATRATRRTLRPLDAGEDARLSASLADVEGPLQSALLRLGRAVLSRG